VAASVAKTDNVRVAEPGGAPAESVTFTRTVETPGWTGWQINWSVSAPEQPAGRPL
jgi:hypothetical protein